jgi:hypothetical protein
MALLIRQPVGDREGAIAQSRRERVSNLPRTVWIAETLDELGHRAAAVQAAA